MAASKTGAKVGKRRQVGQLPEADTSRPTAELTNALRPLFRSVIPTTPLEQAIRAAARLEGWRPPGTYEDLTPKRSKAGKQSGVNRRGRAEIRRSILAYARTKLPSQYRRTPYSPVALEALRREFDLLMTKSRDDPDPVVSAMISALSRADRLALQKVSDDTLMADLKELRRRL